MSRNQEERLIYIERKLYWDGYISRNSIKKQFGISTPQATNDLKEYRTLAPENISYNASEKQYLVTESFSPYFQGSISSKSYLDSILSSDIYPADRVSMGNSLEHAFLPMLNRPIKDELLRDIVKAIQSNQIVEMDYSSLSSGKTSYRSISPHALVHDGFRWHVRAFCYKKLAFRDFNLGRIKNIKKTGLPSQVNHSEDLLWSTIVSAQVSINEKLSEDHKEIINNEFDMIDGRIQIEIRAAFIIYIRHQIQSLTHFDEKDSYLVIKNDEDLEEKKRILEELTKSRIMSTHPELVPIKHE